MVHTSGRTGGRTTAGQRLDGATKLSHDEMRDSYERLEQLARVMDSAFKIPGTNIRMGFDALLGLLPGIGDAISAAISSYLIWEARRLGASRFVIARMIGNTAVDTVIGAIPFAGDIFDVAYRSNLRNVTLLRKHLEARGVTPRVLEDVSYKRFD